MRVGNLALPGTALGKRIMPDSAPQQLLHLVIGGELTDLEHTTFKDLDQVEIVGVFPNYATATRPGRRRRSKPWTMPTCAISSSISIGCSIQVKTRSLPVEKVASQCAAQQLGPARCGFARGRVPAASLAHQQIQLRSPNVYEIVEPQRPVILAFWHGQHLMTPFVKKKDIHRTKALISRHRDGEFNAIAAERLGIGTIRGSAITFGVSSQGGIGAFKEMLRALEEKYYVALTRTCRSARGWPASASSCWRGNPAGRSCRSRSRPAGSFA